MICELPQTKYQHACREGGRRSTVPRNVASLPPLGTASIEINELGAMGRRGQGERWQVAPFWEARQ